MSWNKKLLIALCTGAFGCALGFFIHTFVSVETVLSASSDGADVVFATSTNSLVTTSTEGIIKEALVHNSTMLSPEFFDDAYAHQVPVPAATGHVFGLILPHHLLAAQYIASIVSAIPSADVKRIIIIGPDHLSRAHANAVISRATMHTPYGDIVSDTQTIDGLLSSNVITNEEPIFDIEHSINALTPFLKRSFPNATIVPILVKSSLTDIEASRLADALSNDDGTLIISSVDFSHYEPDRVAQFHDRMSRAVLSSEDIALLSKLEIDSPATFDVFLSAMQNRGASKMHFFADANSNTILQTNPTQTTSYVLASFGQTGDVDDTVTVFSAGDMMFDRDVRTFINKFGIAYPFEKIHGDENRFFRGADLFLGNLEGAIAPLAPPVKTIDFSFDPKVADLLRDTGFTAVSLANNHGLDQGRSGLEETKKQLTRVGLGYFGDPVKDDTAPWTTVVRGKKIAVFGYNITDNSLDEASAKKAIQNARTTNDLVIVEIHWGAEYQSLPTSEQRRLGHRFVEWGADAVIGSHPHVIEGMEVWQGKPIFWSLGNFIFDQDWSTETKEGMSIGLAFNKDNITAYLFPVTISHGQPMLANGSIEQQLLNNFADRSTLSDALREEARKGIVELLK